MFANVTTAQYSSPPVVVKRALLQRLLESNNTLLFGFFILCSEFSFSAQALIFHIHLYLFLFEQWSKTEFADSFFHLYFFMYDGSQDVGLLS